MRKPAYSPTLTLNDFIRAWKYDGINAEVFSFLRDVVDAVFVPVSAEKKETFILFLAEIYNVGRQNGIREERCNRRAKSTQHKQTQPNVERQGYIDAIFRMLQGADSESLRLIWITARTLTRKDGGAHD